MATKSIYISIYQKIKDYEQIRDLCKARLEKRGLSRLQEDECERNYWQAVAVIKALEDLLNE